MGYIHTHYSAAHAMKRGTCCYKDERSKKWLFEEYWRIMFNSKCASFSVRSFCLLSNFKAEIAKKKNSNSKINMDNYLKQSRSEIAQSMGV